MVEVFSSETFFFVLQMTQLWFLGDTEGDELMWREALSVVECFGEQG